MPTVNTVSLSLKNLKVDLHDNARAPNVKGLLLFTLILRPDPETVGDQTHHHPSHGYLNKDHRHHRLRKGFQIIDI